LPSTVRREVRVSFRAASKESVGLHCPGKHCGTSSTQFSADRTSPAGPPTATCHLYAISLALSAIREPPRTREVGLKRDKYDY
ncbi:hypothetical protein GBF38_001551, partial [Nibea albiflora]